MSGDCFRRWGSGRGRNPAGKHIPYRDGDLELAGAPGRSARHLRRPLLAPVSTVQPMSARRKHRPLASARSRVSAEDRRRPLLSATDHPARKSDPSHMTKKPQDPIRGAHCQSAGRWETGNSGCHTSPASWITWDEQSGEPSGCSWSGGTGRQRSHQAERRRLPGCLRPRCWSRSSAPELHSGEQKRHSRSWSTRPSVWVCPVARDRRPAGCDQAGRQPALPASPSRHRDAQGRRS
jgi:hypothetical protein